MEMKPTDVVAASGVLFFYHPIIAISHTNFANAIDPTRKSPHSFIDRNCTQNFQHLLKYIIPVNRLNAFDPILHLRR
jgi:hypothetical protein